MQRHLIHVSLGPRESARRTSLDSANTISGSGSSCDAVIYVTDANDNRPTFDFPKIGNDHVVILHPRLPASYTKIPRLAGHVTAIKRSTQLFVAEPINELGCINWRFGVRFLCSSGIAR